MRDRTVARNYAETLFELARRHEGLELFSEGITAVGTLLDDEPDFRLFLETPRIAAAEKKALLTKVFSSTLPRPLLNFLLVTVDKRRQRLLRGIAEEYQALLDEHENRAHVKVTVARRLDEDTVDRIAERLSALLGKTAVPHVRVDPDILGGVIVRTGDTIYDGSIRRRMSRMRRQLLAADLPSPWRDVAAQNTPQE